MLPRVSFRSKDASVTPSHRIRKKPKEEEKKEKLKPFDTLRSHATLLISLKVKRSQQAYSKSILVLQRNKGTERVNDS